MSYGVGLKDERRTSNNDVAPLRNLISFFVFSAFRIPTSAFKSLFPLQPIFTIGQGRELLSGGFQVGQINFGFDDDFLVSGAG